MTSPKTSWFMMKTIVGFLMTIDHFGVACKANEDNKSSTISLSPRYHSLTPQIDSMHDDYNFLVLLYKFTVQESITEVSRVSNDFAENGTLPRRLQDYINKDKSLPSALESCRLFLSLALYNLNRARPATTYYDNVIITHEDVADFKTWLSAAIADFETCTDGFEYASDQVRKIVIGYLDNSTKVVSNSLSIISKIGDHLGSTTITSFDSISKLQKSNWPPSWLSSEDTKFLDNLIPDVVVAADGSGNYTTINEAIKVAPLNSITRFVIYVKKGIYFENVRVDQTKWNIMMFGDGMNETIVSGNLNTSSGVLATIMTATFVVHGNGFIARDMGFRNTAGAAMKQAVALASSSDQSVFYRCSIDAYQDTLFTQSNRQFYRECNIYGTIDFIFGHSIVVFQNCTIFVKKPLPGQANTITAQGKSTPNVVSGISIQNCDVVAAEDLSGVTTFLGRPWKNFSTTIFMETQLDNFIDPQGWSPWTPNVTPPDTIYYAEYNNRGPGADTSKRVSWKGVRVDITIDEANNFTVESFIKGTQWLPDTCIPFKPDL
ncbi:hypothetical protein DH2020_012635 [Rehmannia glutinosa]|uniref:Pectinesterase n=1 Tax=Rehmannia glutinosa TaxID=99300 RepID=A0ABR0X1B9_REHGL